jgi:endonuclease/exonuclease/phosphatase family metal-dependent hydrolase
MAGREGIVIRLASVIRVMSFNIRYREPADGEHQWERRKALALARIRAFDPDLCGIQECSDVVQAGDLRDGLPGWRFESVDVDDEYTDMVPVLYKPSAFDLVTSGAFWLSDTPDVPGSQSWDSAFARAAVWVELTHRETGRSLRFLNTHVDYQPQAIEQSTTMLRAWIDEAARRLPLVVAGDFNVDKRSSAYRRLAGEGPVFDAYRQVRAAGAAEGTYHDFGRAAEPAALDWILVSDHFVVLDADVDHHRDGSLFPSDHHPVTAVLGWKPV